MQNRNEHAKKDTLDHLQTPLHGSDVAMVVFTVRASGRKPDGNRDLRADTQRAFPVHEIGCHD